jgi:siroheme synthase-like protein
MSEPYIICVDLRDQPVCVVGGGSVAARKIESFLAAGAIVHVIAERLCQPLQEKLKDPALAGRLIWHAGCYRRNLPAGARLVIACTDDRQVNSQVRADCRISRVLCNVVDDPQLCDFIVPAVRQVGPVHVAVSTGGGSPTVARDLAEQFVAQMDPSVADLVELLAQVRSQVQAQISDASRRKEFFTDVSGPESLRVYKERGRDGWWQWFQRQLADYRRQ